MPAPKQTPRTHAELHRPAVDRPPGNRQEAARWLAQLASEQFVDARQCAVYVLDASARHMLLAASGKEESQRASALPRQVARQADANDGSLAYALWQETPCWIADSVAPTGDISGYACLPFSAFGQRGVILLALASEAQGRQVITTSHELFRSYAAALLAAGALHERVERAEQQRETLLLARDQHRRQALEGWQRLPFPVLVVDRRGQVLSVNRRLLETARLPDHPGTIEAVFDGVETLCERVLSRPDQSLDWLSERVGRNRVPAYCRIHASGDALATIVAIPLADLSSQLWSSAGFAYQGHPAEAIGPQLPARLLLEPRPVLGSDLKNVYLRSGASSIGRFAAAIGLSRQQWNTLLRQSAPIRDPSLSMVLRLVDCWPGLLREIEPKLALERVRKLTGVTIRQREFALILGRDGSAFSRLARGDTSLVPPAASLLALLLRILEARPNQWAFFRQLTEIEAKARRIDDIWTTGSWHRKG